MSTRVPLLPVVAAIAALALARPGVAQIFYEIEPNNSAATANPVTCGTEARGYVNAGTVDWYSFTVASNSFVVVNLTARMLVGNGAFIPQARLYASDGVTLLNATQPGAFSPTGAPVSAGTYYVSVVTPPSATSLAYYALDFVCHATGDVPEESGNVDPSTAQTVPCNARVACVLFISEDWFRLDLASPVSSLRIETTSFVGWTLDTELELTNSVGGVLFYNDNLSGSSVLSRIVTGPLAAGTYYVRVYPSPNNPSPGYYRLELDCGALAAALDLQTTPSLVFGPVGCATATRSVSLEWAANERPLLGSNFRLVSRHSPSTIGVLMLGIASAQTTVDLGLIGFPGCPMYVPFTFAQVPFVADDLGLPSVDLPIPGTPGMAMFPSIAMQTLGIDGASLLASRLITLPGFGHF